MIAAAVLVAGIVGVLAGRTLSPKASAHAMDVREAAPPPSTTVRTAPAGFGHLGADREPSPLRR